MMKRIRSLAVAAIVGAVVAGPVAAQDVDQVLASHYEAIGGLDAWQGLQSMKATGKMVMAAMGMEAPLTMWAKRPGKSRMEFSIQGMAGVQAYDGEMAWWQMPFMGSPDPQPMPDDMTSQMREQSDIDGPLVGWQEDGHAVELLGKEDVDGTDAYKLKVTLDTGEVTYYYLDAEYYLPIKTEGTRTLMGAETTVSTVLGDYKKVGGLMMPFSIEISQPTGPVTLVFDTVEVNVDMADDLFAMPQN